MKHFFFVLHLCFFATLSWSYGSQPRWDGNLDLAKIEHELATEEIVDLQPIEEHLQKVGHKKDFMNHVYLAKLRNGLLAVYKPFKPTDINNAHGEIAAYKAAKFMNLQLVPPVVIRTHMGQQGTLHFFVAPSVDTLSYKSFEDVLDKLSKEQQNAVKAFLFLFGQWDFGRHNILLQKNNGHYFPALIDNSGLQNLIIWHLGGHPIVRLGYFETLNTHDQHIKELPLENMQVIEPTIEALHKRFAGKLPLTFQHRLTFSSTPIHYILWHNGFWRIYHKNEQDRQPLAISALSPQLRAKIEKVTKHILDTQIFDHAQHDDFYTPRFMKSFFFRKQELLAHQAAQ